MWERLKFSERFSFVENGKVLHVVADEKVSEAWKKIEW